MAINNLPHFIITVDTEGDDLWSKPKDISTKNSEYLPRFQELCEKYQLKATYLTTYEMAFSNAFKDLGKTVLKNNTGEIGMHLHAWNNPPQVQLTKNDYFFQPYAIEYDNKILREKIRIITTVLEDTFSKKIISHRAGRWAFNKNYAKILVEGGYKIDCSVTPLRSWKNTLGDPNGKGGTDYSDSPNKPYWFIGSSKEFDNSLLEVPMTIISENKLLNYICDNRLLMSEWLKRRLKTYMKPLWLRPNGKNLDQMKYILDYKLAIKDNYAMFMLHSSELMPGSNPIFKNNQAIENLYSQLDELFAKVIDNYQGSTLSEFYNKIVQKI